MGQGPRPLRLLSLISISSATCTVGSCPAIIRWLYRDGAVAGMDVPLFPTVRRMIR